MTVETKHTLSLDDIEAFEIKCEACKNVVSIPLEKCTKTTPQCPCCKEHWYRGGAADNEAILSLASAVEDIKSELRRKPKFSFRIKFTGYDPVVSRDARA
jgi:hypothetical protein